MIIVLSPAKTLDFVTPPTLADYSLPGFLDQSQLLIELLRKFSPLEIGRLMGIRDSLAALNATRFADWAQPFSPDRARPAVLAFNGDVYEGLEASTLSPAILRFAQSHLRILSGLYGLLRPLDLIQPYRLEMGLRLANLRGKDLYTFWGEHIVDALNASLVEAGASVLVNLASDEYFRAIRLNKLSVPVIQPVFEDWKNGRYKIISFYAKRARGLMTRYSVLNRLSEPEGLKGFDEDGYGFVPEASDDKTWVFRRRM